MHLPLPAAPLCTPPRPEAESSAVACRGAVPGLRSRPRGLSQGSSFPSSSRASHTPTGAPAIRVHVPRRVGRRGCRAIQERLQPELWGSCRGRPVTQLWAAGAPREGGPSVCLPRFPHPQSRLRPAFRQSGWPGRAGRPALRPSAPAPPPSPHQQALQLRAGVPCWLRPPRLGQPPALGCTLRRGHGCHWVPPGGGAPSRLSPDKAVTAPCCLQAVGTASKGAHGLPASGEGMGRRTGKLGFQSGLDGRPPPLCASVSPSEEGGALHLAGRGSGHRAWHPPPHSYSRTALLSPEGYEDGPCGGGESVQARAEAREDPAGWRKRVRGHAGRGEGPKSGGRRTQGLAAP